MVLRSLLNWGNLINYPATDISCHQIFIYSIRIVNTPALTGFENRGNVTLTIESQWLWALFGTPTSHIEVLGLKSHPCHPSSFLIMCSQPAPWKSPDGVPGSWHGLSPTSAIADLGSKPTDGNSLPLSTFCLPDKWKFLNHMGKILWRNLSRCMCGVTSSTNYKSGKFKGSFFPTSCTSKWAFSVIIKSSYHLNEIKIPFLYIYNIN